MYCFISLPSKPSHLSHRYIYMITSSHNPTCFVSREIDNLRQPYDKRIVFRVIWNYKTDTVTKKYILTMKYTVSDSVSIFKNPHWN